VRGNVSCLWPAGSGICRLIRAQSQASPGSSGRLVGTPALYFHALRSGWLETTERRNASGAQAAEGDDH
jgi:hypothetical protein